MKKIAGLWCLLFGCIASVNCDAVTRNTFFTTNARTKPKIDGVAVTTTTRALLEKTSFVRNLYITNVSSTAITMLWDAPGSVRGNLSRYEVNAWSSAQSTLGRRQIQVSSQSATIEQLESNTAYTLSVVAVSQEPSGKFLPGVQGTAYATTDPGSVSDLRALQRNARSLKVSWNAPRSSNIFQICVQDVRPAWNSCRFTRNREDTAENLEPETTYAITVAAVRLDETTNIAARGTSTTIHERTICEKSSSVQNLTPTVVSSSAITVRWNAPESVCGNIYLYEVNASSNARGIQSVGPIQVSSQSVTIEKLEPNSAYVFSVLAVSREPSGRFLAGTQATAEAKTDPGPVTDLRVLERNARSLKLRWKALQSRNTFQICVREAPAAFISCQFTTDIVVTISELVPSTAYSIIVAAVRLNQADNIEARGTAATVSESTICETSGPLKFLHTSFSGSSSYILLSWISPNPVCGTLVNITVSFFKRTAINDGNFDIRRLTYGAHATSATITSLMANTVYNFTVSALTFEPSGRDSSGAADSVELQTAPESVKHLETMRITNDSFEASWTAPQPGKVNKLAYFVQLYFINSWGTFERMNNYQTNSTTATFEKLEPVSNYRLNVLASSVLISGTRIFGDTSSIDIRTDCSSPSQPRISNNIVTSPNMDMEVSWSRNPDGCLDISYIIFVTFSNGTSRYETFTPGFVIPDLQPYTNYSIVISAVRTDGLKRRAYRNSSTILVSTPATAPLELTLPLLTQIDSSSADVVWAPPKRWNGQPSGYIVSLVTENGTIRKFYTKNANDTKHHFKNLQPATCYQVQLIAFNTLTNSSAKLLNFTTLQLPASTTFELAVIIPTIVSVALIVVFVVLFGLWMKRRRSKKPEKASSQELSPLTLLKTDGRETMSHNAQQRAKHNPKFEESVSDAPPRDDVYGNAAAVGISLGAFPKFVRSELLEPAPFAAEFKDLKTSITSLQTAGQKLSNKTKNKFKDIIPYDESRVVLTPQGANTDTDYINASFIEGYGGKQRRYIAAQGPTNDTVVDFWRMVLEYRSEVIVMVTRLVEAGVTKCVWYWPENGTKMYGNIEVTLLSSDEFPDYQINVLQVVRNSDGSQLTVKHFYYTSWPDHGVPDYALSMLKFRRNVVAFTGSSDLPTIVHCSAGVGRTGTYIAIDYLLNEARASGRVNVKLCVERLREQRPKMVQTREQYAFIYQAVMEATQAGDTSIACERFCSYYQKLTKNSNELLKKEHEIFAKAIQPLKPESCSVALLPENCKKNVSPEILPANQKRPILLTRSSSAGETDYINAVFLNTSKKKDGFIVTQTPLPHTKGDFWRMVLDYRVGTIVALDSFTNKKAKYWPEMGDGFLLGEVLSVNCVRSSPDSSGTVRTRDFRVNRAKASDGHAVRQFEFLNWPSSDPCPKDVSSLLELISSIDRWTAQAEAGTVLVHCSNGAYKSGLLVAAMNALRCAEAEQVVDVYTTGLLLRQHRPQFLCNEEQYYYLYKIMASFVETFDTYSNFLPSSP